MPSFGEHLKEIREAKGLSVLDFSNLTKINLHFIQAMETDQYKELPGSVFNRGFVKLYAKYCGVDELKLLAEYKERVQPSLKPEFQFLPPEPPSSPHSFHQALPVFLPVVAILTVALISLIIYFRSGEREVRPGVESGNAIASTAPSSTSSDSNANRSIPAVLPPDSADQVDASSSPPPKSGASIEAGSSPRSGEGSLKESAGISQGKGESAAPSMPGLSNGPPVNSDANPTGRNLILQIVAKELTWVSVKRDGKDAFQKNLLPNESIQLYAKDKFDIVCGNAGGVTLILDGKTLPTLGRRGEVKIFSLDRSALNAVN